MSTALATLLEQAESERDQIQAAAQRAEEHARRAQAQADQLDGYRGEYQNRWASQFRQLGAVEILHCYRSFGDRIDEALVQQQQQIDAAKANAERLRQRLVAAEMRVASVRKLIERREHERQRVQARRDQRQTDETAQQIRWRALQAESAQP
ncbi:flagellar export protein FliJ [Rubrivivax gelatinosus]|uniref:Flagellar FliJ protein n=1 Tax=Rubrivivax gelatinosus TaxID=28068 RepID=A0A4R2M654_RUBGE|nr:flagellar export protein FliJ [Rubrivivax gelatinosus]MBK1690397.1 flagellar export protein FliJ [Rubrivivax gelatinosus]TCP01551.1 flagellar FliJ protein [Rubrivivax gelatinosus]